MTDEDVSLMNMLIKSIYAFYPVQMHQIRKRLMDLRSDGYSMDDIQYLVYQDYGVTVSQYLDWMDKKTEDEYRLYLLLDDESIFR